MIEIKYPSMLDEYELTERLDKFSIDARKEGFQYPTEECRLYTAGEYDGTRKMIVGTKRHTLFLDVSISKSETGSTITVMKKRARLKTIDLLALISCFFWLAVAPFIVYYLFGIIIIGLAAVLSISGARKLIINISNEYGDAEIYMDHIFKDIARSEKDALRIPDKNEWMCPKCHRINQNYVGTCGCGTEKAEALRHPVDAEKLLAEQKEVRKKKIPENKEWTCPKCGRINQHYVGTCGCGTEKPKKLPKS